MKICFIVRFVRFLSLHDIFACNSQMFAVFFSLFLCSLFYFQSKVV